MPSTIASSSSRFDDYFGGRAAQRRARAARSCPTTSCAGSSCARARRTSSSTTSRPTSSTSSNRATSCRWSQAPGVDYQYVGLEPARSRPRGRPGPPGARLRHRHAARSSSICGAASARRRPACCRRCPGRIDRRSASVSARSRSRRARCSTKPAIRDPDGDGPAPRLRLTPEDVEHAGVQPAAGGGDPAEPPRGRHRRSTCASYEFATLFADVLEGNFQTVRAAVDRRLAGRSGHPAARVSFEAGAARRLQPRPLQQPAGRSRCSTKPPSSTRRGAPAGAVPARCSGSSRVDAAVHQPLAQDQRRRRPAIADRRPRLDARRSRRFSRTSHASQSSTGRSVDGRRRTVAIYNVARMTKKPSRFLQTPIEPFVVEAGSDGRRDPRADGADFVSGTQPRDRASRLAEDARRRRDDLPRHGGRAVARAACA